MSNLLSLPLHHPPVPSFIHDTEDKPNTWIMSKDKNQITSPFRDGPMERKQDDNASLKRAILSPLSTNSQHRPTPLAHYSDKKPLSLIRKSIPKPALIPDVFGSPRDGSLTPKDGTASSSVHPSKRSRDSNAQSLPKRPKVEKETADNTSGRHRAEEDKWRAKWVKVFPTLVFHFEIGSDHGPRRALMTRIAEMGAVSEKYKACRDSH